MEESIFSIPFSEWSAAQGFEFSVTYLIPIITCVALIFGGIWTLYKYFKEKNRDFYSSILEKVYSPLYKELVKMEYCRQHLNKADEKKFKVKDIPFVTLMGERKNIKMEIGKTIYDKEEYTVYDFDNVLKELLEKVSMEYAPRDLVSLIENYFFLEKIKGMPNFNYEDEKIKIQRLIRRNVIIGYKKYRRKLGLKDVTISKFCYSWFGFIWFN